MHLGTARALRHVHVHLEPKLKGSVLVSVYDAPLGVPQCRLLWRGAERGAKMLELVQLLRAGADAVGVPFTQSGRAVA